MGQACSKRNLFYNNFIISDDWSGAFCVVARCFYVCGVVRVAVFEC
jgi:hypothetical protein